MGDNYGCAPNHELVKSCLDDALAVVVQRTCGLIKQQNLGVFQYGARNSNALLLTPTHLDAFVPNLSVVSVHDVRMSVNHVRAAIRKPHEVVFWPHPAPGCL
jgi:hypothetical protein